MREFITKVHIVFLLLFCQVTFAQSREQLEIEKEAIREKIYQTNSLLSRNKNTTAAQLSDFKLLSTKLERVRDLAKNIQTELSSLNTKITSKEKDISVQENDLVVLRENYANSIVSAYKRNSIMNEMVFLLSSNSFNSAFRRMQYLRKINSHRNRQADSIKEMIQQLEKDKKELLKTKDSKNQLLVEQTKQQNTLTEIKAELSNSIDKLKEQNTELVQLLANQRKEEKRLQATIQAVIAKELAAKRADAAKRAEEARRAEALAVDKKETEAPVVEEEKVVKEEPKTYANAPESARLSKSFAANKGLLPWPLDRGVIISSLGEYGINDLPGIKKERDGIDFRTQNNSVVKCIFSGQVRSVTTIRGFNKVVIVSHGDYFSVYGNLKSVNVSAGEKLTTGQQIGIVETNAGISELHLQIWKQQNRLDPKQWLLRK